MYCLKTASTGEETVLRNALAHFFVTCLNLGVALLQKGSQGNSYSFSESGRLTKGRTRRTENGGSRRTEKAEGCTFAHGAMYVLMRFWEAKKLEPGLF